ncbi:MAG TPA: SpoIIE family protein phosphatase [Bryobacteraceae bacterium]|jgi:sigma-B regulation protein RsbU (phosphoserine phosphatase)|nr:SpoIIE family protein phosphatase [Bryobacteraceae bacterium]
MSRRILVVDDEPDLKPLVLQKYRKRIAAGELDFSFACDGEDALRVLEEEPEIELIATDINMPVMDGLTLLGEIRNLSRLTKTIIVSAYDDLENIRTAMNRGAYDFVTKPIDFADLERTIDKTLHELDELRCGREARERLSALEVELQLATKIQRSILPEIIEGHKEFDIGAAMLPARQVSGDFYDFFLMDGNRLGLAIGDVSGKGIPAALFMAVSRTLVRAVAMQGGSPRHCLEQVNRILLKQSTGDVFLTLLYGVMDLTTGEFEFSAGGQTPPFLCSPDRPGAFLREPRGMMLGLLDEAVYESRKIRIEHGETLVLYTDGVTEAENAEGKFFTEKCLQAVLDCNKDNPAKVITSRLISALESFTGGDPRDDITVLALRRL